ncbi:MAG: glutathione S-transferase C-terminal domain-containing protein [Streptococcaceae bacterium]|jgi:putative glutathione S-transferase|nr:glutathione S-transferase C-terminal domain-containing protein [Streptococcaceae bacterium]MCH4176699.1 glutathione S-transferase C-terminal domain-containing protein [Streptococcaceae bacterium]
MAEIVACGISANKKGKIAEKNNKFKDKYTEELAKYFGSINNSKPRPIIGEEIDEKGFWVRQRNSLTTPFGDGEGDLKAADGRYIIYWASVCNWSNRPVIARDILGLQDVVRDYRVDHTPGPYGWGFPEESDFKDPSTSVYFLSDLYVNADSSFEGRATTPTLADFKEKKAVNNDYHRLTNYLEVQFRAFQPKDAPDLYPVKYRKEIDEFNDWLFPNINDGHYRQAFARSIGAYEDGQKAFSEGLEKLEKRLADNRFLFGDYITDSDIRLYVSLIKWETDFYVLAGPQKKRIIEYKNIWEYIKELYNIPEFKRYTNIPQSNSNDRSALEGFGNYISRIAAYIDWDKELKTDGSRAKLSSDPTHIYLKHPKGETAEDYQSEISETKWNSPDAEIRADKYFLISQDASINPLKGLLRNDEEE